MLNYNRSHPSANPIHKVPDKGIWLSGTNKFDLYSRYFITCIKFIFVREEYFPNLTVIQLIIILSQLG